MDFQQLAQLLFPNVTQTPKDMEAIYPKRSLPDGAMVTRIAPSPTGFMHLGNLFGALCDERLAHQSNGIFYLRIEDTDQKREVEGGVDTIISVFEKFGLKFDEGVTASGENGPYVPYKQRQRANIYHVYAKHLVKKGRAYPCFCSEEQLSDMRVKQGEQKSNFGYYGQWANCRNLSLDEIKERLSQNCPYVLRFRSNGDPTKYIKHNDSIKGEISFPENDQDFVLLKSDSIPTYHFAHVIDDHLMRTTHVVRGEEWLATLPFHLQLFDVLELDPPLYAHTAQLMKLDNGGKRKLSKRKDPELALDFYHSKGYPIPCVLEYLMTLLNSNFEEWRLENPSAPMEEFPFSLSKMSVSGALFDFDKFDDVSKNVISLMNTETVWNLLKDYTGQYDPDFYKMLTRDEAYSKAIISIGRNTAKPRKDIASLSEFKRYSAFFFDELFQIESDFPGNVSKQDRNLLLDEYKKIYSASDDQETWFEKIKELAKESGFAPQTKLYKKNPELYKGHVGDVSMILRVAVTGRQNSPDMFDVMKILGKDTINKRIETALGL